MSPSEAEKELAGTYSRDKNEILFSRFGINYNNEPNVCKKGSSIFREYTATPPPPDAPDAQLSKTQLEKRKKATRKAEVVLYSGDVIQDKFWEEHPYILGGKEVGC